MKDKVSNTFKATSVGLNESKLRKLLAIQKELLKKENLLLKNTETIEFLMDYYIKKEKVEII